MSDNKRGKKRPKSYYRKCAQGAKKFKSVNNLAAGMKGFLVTCNKYEKETVREMYNLLNEYADQMYGPEIKLNDPEADNDDSGSEEEDMEKAMAKETSAIKETAKTERRFQNTDTKTNNCIFIRTTVESPCDLAHKIFTDIVEKQIQKARYALRMTPISITCKTNMNDIKAAAETMLKPHFETEFGVGLKYTTMCKLRNNQSVSRTVILPSIGGIIHELNPLHKVCHDEPDLVVIVEVIRNVCLMSVVKDYFNFRKYNFHEVLKKKDTNDTDTTKTDDTPDTTKADDTPDTTKTDDTLDATKTDNTPDTTKTDDTPDTTKTGDTLETVKENTLEKAVNIEENVGSECKSVTVIENKEDCKSTENNGSDKTISVMEDKTVVNEVDKGSELDSEKMQMESIDQEDNLKKLSSVVNVDQEESEVVLKEATTVLDNKKLDTGSIETKTVGDIPIIIVSHENDSETKTDEEKM